MPTIRNYIGGTIETPCVSGGVMAWALGRCAKRDYLSWKLAARDMWRDAIEPTWKAYADAALTADPDWSQDDDREWQAVETWRDGYNKLPEIPWYATGDQREYAVQLVVSLMVAGDALIGGMLQRIEELGQVPPELPEPPEIDFGDGTVNLPIPANDGGGIPWWAYLAGAGVMVGTIVGVYYEGKSRGRKGVR